MSKLRALELAVGLHTALASADGVMVTAEEFAKFLGDESQVIGGVTGKPKPTRTAAAKEREPEAPAALRALELAVSAEQEAVNVAAAEARQKADAAVAAAKATTAARVAAEAAATAAGVAPSGVTEADIKQVVGKLAVNASAGGAPKVREILGTFKQADGVKPTINISTLQPKDYAAAKKAIEAVLEAAELAA